MSGEKRGFRCERILENDLPYEIVDSTVHKMAQSAADAFIEEVAL